MAYFEIDSMIRGNHVYKDRWDSFIGEVLVCQREPHNFHDPFAVAVMKTGNIVGHIPRTISAASYVFLGRSGCTISCTVTGSRRYSRDLPQGGLEIPCTIKFEGGKNSIEKIQALINKKNLGKSANTSTTRKTEDSSDVTALVTSNSPSDQDGNQQEKDHLAHDDVQDDSIKSKRSCLSQSLASIKEEMLPEIKRIKVEQCDSDADDREDNTTAVWTKFGKAQLSKLNLQEIDCGNWLGDSHINFAQTIIKSQFNIQGLQNTLLQRSSKPAINQLQIVHTRGNHWIVASTILSPPGVIMVYDSLYDQIDCETVHVILNLFGGNGEIEMARIQKQNGTNDCGLFAVANSVELAKKQDPTKINYIQRLMRPHLINCFTLGKMRSFPSQHTK